MEWPDFGAVYSFIMSPGGGLIVIMFYQWFRLYTMTSTIQRLYAREQELQGKLLKVVGGRRHANDFTD